MDGSLRTIQELEAWEVQLVVEDVLTQAQLARTNPKAFVEYVFKEETKRTPIKVVPHQELLLEFVAAHDKCVIAMPPGHTKTFSVAAVVTKLLGDDPTVRGAIVSATQTQAEKPLGMVRDYIESSPELRIVYPELIPSLRKGDSWSQTELTINRPPGIRDASLVAVGYRGAIDGARLRWVVVDDLLNDENTLTPEQRDAVHHWFDTSVMTRLDSKGSKVIVMNTAWHQDDLVHRLEKMGWPLLRMGVSGYIEIVNTDFDSDLIRPSSPGSLECRLVANDPDPENRQTLWPERISIEGLEELRRTHLPSTVSKTFEQRCRNDADAQCKEEWITRAKERGRGLTFVSRYDGPEPTFTGVDLGIATNEQAADTALFTFKVDSRGYRTILNIEAGKWDGPTIIRKLIATQRAYNSVLRVENNAAQDFIRQFALAEDVALPITAHTTGRMKAHPEHGVQGLFIELSNGAWIIPCDDLLQVDAITLRWINACLFYSPAKHTDDVLMACYFAREQAKKYGIPSGGATSSMTYNHLNVSGQLMAR